MDVDLKIFQFLSNDLQNFIFFLVHPMFLVAVSKARKDESIHYLEDYASTREISVREISRVTLSLQKVFISSSHGQYIDYNIFLTNDKGEYGNSFIRLKTSSLHGLAESSNRLVKYCGYKTITEVIIEKILNEDNKQHNEAGVFIQDFELGFKVLFQALGTRGSLLGLPSDWAKTQTLRKFDKSLESFGDSTMMKYLYLYSQSISIDGVNRVDREFFFLGGGRTRRSYPSNPEMLFFPIYNTDLPFILDRINNLEKQIRTVIKNL